VILKNSTAVGNEQILAKKTNIHLPHNLHLSINNRMATVLEEKKSRNFQILSTYFSRPTRVIFYQVILMMEILESNSFTFYWKLNKTI